MVSKGFESIRPTCELWNMLSVFFKYRWGYTRERMDNRVGNSQAKFRKSRTGVVKIVLNECMEEVRSSFYNEFLVVASFFVFEKYWRHVVYGFLEKHPVFLVVRNWSRIKKSHSLAFRKIQSRYEPLLNHRQGRCLQGKVLRYSSTLKQSIVDHLDTRIKLCESRIEVAMERFKANATDAEYYGCPCIHATVRRLLP